MIEVVVTDRNLNLLGQVASWTSVDVMLRLRQPATIQVELPLTPTSNALFGAGNRLAIIRDGEWFATGPIERPGRQRFSIDGDRVLTVTASDDLALICGRRVYPDPAHAITAQAAARRTFTAANGEDVLQELVNENAGPAALAARQIPQLAIAADASVGGTVTMGFRLEQMGDALRAVAEAAGGLGFQTQQVNDTIEFQVYEPRDLRDSVLFSVGLGNLLSYDYDPEAPRSTVALVGDGSGTGTSRVFRERISAQASTWWRLETLVDRSDTTNTTEMDAAGDEALAEEGETASLSVIALDTRAQEYGTHYRLGDLVSVELITGDVIADVVRAVRLVVTPDEGETLSPLIGTQGVTTDRQWLTLIRRVRRDVERLKAV